MSDFHTLYVHGTLETHADFAKVHMHNTYSVYDTVRTMYDFRI